MRKGASERDMIRAMMGTILAGWMALGSANGQPADTHPAFEVASVKVAGRPMFGVDYQRRGGPGTDDPGQFTYPQAPLSGLLAVAYGVRPDQISGPDWLNTERYDVVAKVPPNATKDQFDLMLQDLLAKRFHVVLHHETKDFPVYWLVVVNGGPKMKPAPPDSGALAAAPAGAAGWLGTDKNGFPVLPPGRAHIFSSSNGLVRGTCRMTMAELAAILGFEVNLSNGVGMGLGGRGAGIPRVIDKTGLSGKFDFTLEFGFGTAPAVSIGDEPPVANAASDPGRGPSIFTALEKQLGLKLEGGRTARLDMVVVDHADKVPTPN